MVRYFLEAVLQVACLVPFMLLSAGLRTKRACLGLLRVACVYVPYRVIENLPRVSGSFDFIHGGWNWDGKLLGIGWGIVCYFLFRRNFAGHDCFTIHPERANRKQWISAAAGIVVLSAVVWYMLGRSAFDVETLAFQLTIPGIDEEIMYRGILLGLLMAALPERIRLLGQPGVLWTAVLFGLAHALTISSRGVVGFDPLYFLQTGFAGYVWGWITVRSRSIVPAMLSHNFSNFFGTLATMIK